ncbi:MAG TPA: ABC transporter substrate-binding protein [Candidatus Sumerlaeota bacterium]|nr:ABC transporter substrate-binding protein [Candidatus Sumerlaeota bacterium]HON51511.1 ABC transporter substrate-binding protein [Candidatus Sumerlaeota bacterium]HOR65237.1 ABC transporter substrate-binding protein [Candidatus Sumerlaeota bacterium]HRU54934.1 ABC transporter substrate-binding protein [Candidatus Sumerlaeia bacterium]
MRINKYLLSALMISIAAICCNCSRPENQAKGKTEIVFWTGWTGQEMDALQKIIDRFNASQPSIHCRLVTVAGVYQKVRIAFAGGDTPDLMSCIWAEELASYAIRDVLEPLDSYIAQSGRNLAKEYMPGLWRMFHFDGKVYALAMTTNGTVFFYNKDIFQEVGWGAGRVPKTLDEFEEINDRCVKYSKDGNLERYGTLPYNVIFWGYVFGGSWYDEAARKVTMNRPENVRALEWMQKISHKYDVRKLRRFEKSFGGWITSANCPFYVGKAAIYHSGEYMTHHLKKYAPQINYGWFAYPSPPGGRANCCLVGGSVFAIPAASKHKAEAWELLNYLTQPEQIKEFCLALHNLPPLIEVAKDPAFASDPVYRDLAEIMSGENVFGPPPLPIWARCMTELNRAEEYAVYGDGSPQQLLDDVQTRMQKELDRLWEQKRGK